MERHDVSQGDRFAEMVSAAEAGVDVEITRGGAVVARVVGEVKPGGANGRAFLDELAAITKLLPPEILGTGDMTGVVRAMRDEEW